MKKYKDPISLFKQTNFSKTIWWKLKVNISGYQNQTENKLVTEIFKSRIFKIIYPDSHQYSPQLSRILIQLYEDGYVCWVKWKLTGTEGDKTVESTGKTKLERPSSALEAYDSLTEEKVLGWVKAKINAESPAVMDTDTGKTAVERMEAIMDKKMGWLNATATADGKPF